MEKVGRYQVPDTGPTFCPRCGLALPVMQFGSNFCTVIK